MTLRLLSLLIPGVVATAAHAADTRSYVVLFQGKDSGRQTTSVAGDGRITVDFHYRDNGRGPDVKEDIVLAKDGTPASYHLAGTTTYGAPQDETWQVERATARWKSNADQGESPLKGPTLYSAVGESSPELAARAIAALLKQPGRRLPVLPAGEAAVEKLAETTLRGGTRSQRALLYALTGIDFDPIYVWLTPGPQPRFFAYVVPGWLQIVDAAWQPQAPALEAAQVAAQSAQLGTIAHKFAHRVADPIVIRNARVFDSEHARLGPASDVYVNRGRIAAIYPAGSEALEPGTVIDAGGRVLLPGLFDMHDHENAWRGLRQVAAGVTTTRDLANDNAVLADQIARIDRGEIVGPRIVPAGFIEGQSEFSSKGGFVVNSVEEAKRAVDWYAQRGFPQVKLYNSFRREWVAETCKHAHARGLRVSGHVPAFMRSAEVVQLGFDELQHMNQVFLNFVSEPDTDSRDLSRFYLVAEKGHALDLDSRPVRRFLDLLKEHRTVVDPTLTTFSFMTYRQGEVNPPYAPVIDHLPAAVQRGLHTNTLNVTAENQARYQASYAKMIELAGRMHRAGIDLVAGTDDIAGFALQGELEYYVKAGIPAAEVLRIATWNGAKYTRTLDRLGSVTPGKLADLILVDGDPTQDIADIRKVGLVMKEGTIFYPSELYPAIGVKPFAPPVRYTTTAK